MTQPANRRIVTEAAVDGHMASKISDTASAARAALNATYANVGAGVVATFAKYPGLDPTGVADSRDSILQFIKDLPAGVKGIIPPGTYRVAGSVIPNINADNSKKSVDLNLRGCKFINEGSSSVFAFSGTWGTTYAVTAVASTTVVDPSGNSLVATELTIASPPAWVKGDIVKVYADDVAVGVRPGTGGEQTRVGQFVEVFSVGASTVTVLGSLLGDTYATNVRVAKLNPIPVRIEGGIFDASQSQLAGSSVAGMINLKDLLRPTMTDVKVLNSCNAAIAINSCYEGVIDSPSVDHAVDDPANSRYGYGIIDNSSWGTVVRNPRMKLVRHGFTTGAATIAAGDTNPGAYGRTFYPTVENGLCTSPSSAAWDTHSEAWGARFVNCRAISARVGFQLRGAYCVIEGSRAEKCNTDINIFTESAGGASYGHVVNGHFSLGNTYRVIDNQVNVAGSPNAGVLETRYNYINNLVVTGAQRQWLELGNATIRFVAPQIEAAATISSNIDLIKQSANSVLEGFGGVFDFRKNTGGTGVDIFEAGAGSLALLKWTNLRILNLSAHSSSLTRVIRGVSNYTVDVSCQITYRLSGSSVMGDGYGTVSIFEWIAENNADNSEYKLSSGSAIAAQAAATWIRQTRQRSILHECQPAGGAYTLYDLPTGQARGARLIIMNTSATGTVVVPHGGTSLTNLTGAANLTLNPGQSVTLVWLAALWNQVS